MHAKERAEEGGTTCKRVTWPFVEAGVSDEVPHNAEMPYRNTHTVSTPRYKYTHSRFPNYPE